MPVAGMAYLDRPTPAGYFIFPDLSVRHEGKYRLSFNLYEEQKDPKDADVESGLGGQEGAKVTPLRNGTNSTAPQAHCHFRLEVKSEPFAVYSAKKFPGLKESTSISRVVSEQGCRVRIRRDVRMRRRDPKTRGVYDEYEDDTVYARSNRFATPAENYKPQIPERPRPIGNGASEAAASYHQVEQHRPSMAEVSYYNHGGFQPHSAAPLPINVNSGAGSHLAFGNPPTPNFIQANFQPVLNQPPTSLQASNEHHPYSATSRTGQILGLANGYSQPQSVPTAAAHSHISVNPLHPNAISSNPSYAENNGYNQPTEYRQPLVSSGNQGYSLRNLDPYPSIEAHHPAPSTYYYQQGQTSNPAPLTPTDHALPPLKSLEPSCERKYEFSAPTSTMGQAVSSSPCFTGLETPTSLNGSLNPVRSGKRSYGTVFDTGHMNQPLYGGMRPSSASHGQDRPQIEAEDGTTLDDAETQNMKMLAYRRADGRQQIRKCPSPVSD